MEFYKVWESIESVLENKRNFTTLIDGKEFEARRAINAVRIDSVTVTQPRVIGKEEFQKIWNIFKDLDDDKKYHPGNYSKNTVNASYILTIFAEIFNK
jgi:hypothetical protein